MLHIREEQLTAFRTDRLGKFESDLLHHAQRFYPQICQGLDDRQLRQLIRRCGARAKAHGFSTERDICKYMNISLTFGSDFDRNGIHAWAITILKQRLAPNEKMQRLYAAALENEGA